MLSLPSTLRSAFKQPFGPVYTDAAALLEDAGRPVIAVGDVVTHHLVGAGHNPAAAVVDGRTEREPVGEEVHRTLSDLPGTDPDSPGRRTEVANPPGTLVEPLLAALADAVADPDPVTVAVDGEEDLATLPAVLVTPTGGTVVYGQPGEGMVRVAVTPETKAEMRSLLERFDGDVAGALATLGVETGTS